MAAEFYRGRESVEDDGGSGCPKDATTDENVKITLNMFDRRQDLRSIASKVGLSFGAVQLILTNLRGLSKVLERWVTRWWMIRKRLGSILVGTIVSL